ncbi:anti-sigma factor antagonist [Streptomyces sp. NPDC088707]|uniref:anti-sigma factor antagonist n=1 Tax=Streptomyces sp. NPDC088707 TaxID=3365871 RepID=UPI0038290303
MSPHPERPPGTGRTSGAVDVAFERRLRRVRAHVSGEIDMDNAAELQEDLTAALTSSDRGLDIDLASVTFCDSSGLHALLHVNQLALQAGKSVVLTALSRPVARLLHSTGAERVLAVHGRPGSSAQRLQVATRRFGPTFHLRLTGELDMDTRPALEEVQAALDGVDVVACDMRDLIFIDVVGLYALVDFARRLHRRGIAFFTFNWQPQPRRLLDVVDELCPAPDGHGRPTRLLRSLQDFTAAARTADSARAREDGLLRVAFPLP